jgi:flagellar basal-body rod modification protein FlgD
MAVSGATNAFSPAPPNSSQPATRGSQELGKDQFLRLMMTQMQNQDPTAPMDNQQMIAQMAQFSTLEIMQRSEQTMSSLLVAQAAANQQSAINLVGRNVVTKSDSLTLTSGQDNPQIAMQLPEKTKALDIVIVDKNGKEVRHIKAGAQEAGPFSVPWDGRDDNGNRLPDGEYSVRVNAINEQGKDMGVNPEQVFHVDGVIFENGIARIRTGDTTLSMSEVVEVRG